MRRLGESAPRSSRAGRTRDANGNLTDKGTSRFKDDYKSMIVQVLRRSDSVLIARYRYDTLGRRVEKSTGDGTERYIRSHAAQPGNIEDLIYM